MTNNYTVDFYQEFQEKIANNWRIKSPRPSRIPLPIPVGVSNTGMNHVSEMSITLEELMRIKDICRSHLSDHYMLTPSAIYHLGIKMNCSTIEAYTPPVPSEIRSFVK